MSRAIVLVQSFFSIFSLNVFAKNVDVLKSELKSEIVRKSIHFLIALSPVMAVLNRPFTIAFLLVGTVSYIAMESLRFYGVKVPIISSITNMASRPRDAGRFIMGPVTLGFGALLALVLFSSQAAAIAIYAMAFGDGIASLVGKVFGKCRPLFLAGKSVEGSLACFAVVFVSAYVVSGNLHIAFAAAFTAMIVEAIPLKDYDNLIIPIAVGLVVQLF